MSAGTTILSGDSGAGCSTRTRTWARPITHRALVLQPDPGHRPILISSAAIVAVLAWAVRRDTAGRKRDLTFSLAVTAMLLVSPIAWEHYLLLLLVPLAVVWFQLPASLLARMLFLVIVAAFWLGYPLVWTVFTSTVGRPRGSIRSALSRTSFMRCWRSWR